MTSIREHGRARTAWDFCIVLLILATAALVPYQLAFVRVPTPGSTAFLYLLDLVFAVDIVLNFRTTYREMGTEVTDTGRIAARYLRGMFAVDLLAAMPFDILLLGRPDLQVSHVPLALVVRLLHLLRIVRLVLIFRRWEDQSWTNSGALRITRFLVFVMLFIHWISCAWFFIPYLEHFPADSWVALAGLTGAPAADQYVRSLYWGITTMTTVGYGDITPHRTIEYVFTMGVMLLGASMYAFIIGNIASMVSNLDSAKAAFRHRVDSIHQYLRSRQAPANLSEQVRNFYEYFWEQHRGVREHDMFTDLPAPLRLEVLEHLTREFLENVPLFRFSSPALRDELLLSLEAHTYAPAGMIVREGEHEKAMYFISAGRLEIVRGHDGEVCHELGPGDYFGHLSLLLGERRTAGVRAVTYCEVFVLREAEYKRIRRDYPEFLGVLKQMSSQRTEHLERLVMQGIVL